MPIKVSCNSCGGVLHAPDDSAGKRGRCPTCGTILAIPADAPRVAAEAAPPPGLGVPAPQPASTYGLAPPEPLAFPRPPAFGAPEGTKSSYSPGGRTPPAAGAMASRLPPDPRKSADPFVKTAQPPVDKVARRWSRVSSGLGLIRLGLLCWILALLLPTLLSMVEMGGSFLPQKDPGLLGVAGLALSDEIKVGMALLGITLGGLMIMLGRFRVSSIPSESGARGLATAAALATGLAFLGYLAVVSLAISATLQGTPPKLIPNSDVISLNHPFQYRVDAYLRQTLLDGNDMVGAVQRAGALALVVFGLLAELWFLGAMGRSAVHLRSKRASGRVNRFVILLGMLFALLCGGLLAFDLGGRQWVLQELMPKWDALAPGVKIALRAGVTGLFGLWLLFSCGRIARGVQQAVNENTDAQAA
ncbi:hypothetical protein BH11PLA2_BH11PLA2_13680 [soil metagenome]